MVDTVLGSLLAKARRWKSVECFGTMIVASCLLASLSPRTTCYAAVLPDEATPRSDHIHHDNDVGRARTFVDRSMYGKSFATDPSPNNYNFNNFHQHDDDLDDSVEDGSSATVGRMSIANMTCETFEQPLNHFVPRGRSPAYEERYCTYYGYADDGDETSPIFFYTGNESPLEEYINQTGLMWELAPKFGARIVFAEHRYEGESLPSKTLSKDCLSYGSTMQALADYARLLEEMLNPDNVAPVIVFGGSYGGMLSAWMRMKYPHLVTGAIAASAPIGAFPQAANSKIDYSARVLAQGIKKPYPPTATQSRGGMREKNSRIGKGRQLEGTSEFIHLQAAVAEKSASAKSNYERTGLSERNFCSDNLLAAWPLITWLAQQDNKASSNLLQKSFSMCEPLHEKNGDPLVRWAQRVWFDLAEGSFSYPNSYIPFALLHKKVNLPPWPTQHACWRSSNLHKDWGVRFQGNKKNVNYSIDYGDSGISLDVNWDKVKLVEKNVTHLSSTISIEESSDVVGLLQSVRDAVSIWYNITKDVQCYNISQAAPNSNKMTARSRYSKFDPEKECREAMIEQGSWGTLCCNDEMNLVITEAQGMGMDFFWPPSHPKGVRTYKDMISNATSSPCPDPNGIYGYSKEPYDLLSKRLETYYGGINMKGHSNIVFSNGLLDPWSAGGVYEDNINPHLEQNLQLGEDKVTIQNINENDVIALIIPFGGHHSDLMYRSDSDPSSVTEGRKFEASFIVKWIRNFLQSSA